PVIPKQRITTPVLGDVQVRPSVLVVVAPGGVKEVAPDADRVAFARHLEASRATIYQQDIGGPELVEHTGTVPLLVFGLPAPVFPCHLRGEELIGPIKVTFFDLGDATGRAGADGSG